MRVHVPKPLMGSKWDRAGVETDLLDHGVQLPNQFLSLFAGKKYTINPPIDHHPGSQEPPQTPG